MTGEMTGLTIFSNPPLAMVSPPTDVAAASLGFDSTMWANPAAKPTTTYKLAARVSAHLLHNPASEINSALFASSGIPTAVSPGARRNPAQILAASATIQPADSDYALPAPSLLYHSLINGKLLNSVREHLSKNEPEKALEDVKLRLFLAHARVSRFDVLSEDDDEVMQALDEIEKWNSERGRLVGNITDARRLVAWFCERYAAIFGSIIENRAVGNRGYYHRCRTFFYLRAAEIYKIIGDAAGAGKTERRECPTRFMRSCCILADYLCYIEFCDTDTHKNNAIGLVTSVGFELWNILWHFPALDDVLDETDVNIFDIDLLNYCLSAGFNDKSERLRKDTLLNSIDLFLGDMVPRILKKMTESGVDEATRIRAGALVKRSVEAWNDRREHMKGYGRNE